MRKLINKKCELLPTSAQDLVYDPEMLNELIQHLQLKLYKKFQYYNFHDIMISLAQMFLTQISQREIELGDILEEYKRVHGDRAEDLDDVIQKIEDIQQLKDV